MTTALGFEHLVQALHHLLASRPDDQTRKHSQYAITEAALGAVAVCWTQSLCLLASQRTRQQTQGRSTADRLCGIAGIPWDHRLDFMLQELEIALLPDARQTSK